MFLLNVQGDLKKITIERKDEFCTKDERLPMLFQHLKDSGAKTFLLTNSEWWYTDAVISYFYSLVLCHCNNFAQNRKVQPIIIYYLLQLMSHLFDLPGVKPWREYFDYIVVDARKPAFFGEGTVLR